MLITLALLHRKKGKGSIPPTHANLRHTGIGQHNNASPHAMHREESLRAWSAQNRARKQGRRHAPGANVGARPCNELKATRG